MSTPRFSPNGKPATNSTAAGCAKSGDDADKKASRYVKNEIDLRLDKLTELWQAMEGKLLAMQPPRQISCYYDSVHHGEDGEIEERFYIGIQRHGDRWRVCHASIFGGKDPAPKDWKPITDCGIEVRVRAANHIENLEFEVIQTGKYFIPVLDRAIDTLQKCILGESDED